MRESFGGLFLIKIMLVFIVIYNSILAVAVNYAMAFRVKNKVIDLLEQYEGCNQAADKINNYIASVGYYRRDFNNQTGVSISEETVTSNNRKGYYYKVATYIQFDFPFIGNLFKVPINGETKIIYGIDSASGKCPPGNF